MTKYIAKIYFLLPYVVEWSWALPQNILESNECSSIDRIVLLEAVFGLERKNWSQTKPKVLAKPIHKIG